MTSVISSRLKRYKDVRAQAVLCESLLKIASTNPLAPPDAARKLRCDLKLARSAELECRKEVEALISKAPESSNMQEILRMKYINFMTWDAIADCLMLDRRWILRLHKRALSAIIKSS